VRGRPAPATAYPARPMNVAIVTCSILPEGNEYDLPLLPALERAGAAVALEVWDDPGVRWHDYDRVVVRWPWDYTYKRDAFVEWAETVGDRLHNRPAVLRWNSEKSYLADLAAAGLPVVDTALVRPGDSAPELSGEVVVKPTVSAGARDTGRFSPAVHHDATALIDRITGAGGTAMIQPYLPAVEARGETAIVVIAGRESHVLRKRAVLAPDEEAPLADHDLRSAAVMFDPELVQPGEAGDGERELAARVIGYMEERFGQAPLYARVDMLTDAAGSPVLLELEAVEPALYLQGAPGAAERLADAILKPPA
jgi:hypothetical protein